MTSGEQSEEVRAETAAEDQSDTHEAVSPEEIAASLSHLFEVAAEQGRDWKLIDALLITITEFISEKGRDVLTPIDSSHPEQRLRPEFKARIKAIVDSFSDDEAAAFLGIGTRQVRRRARNRSLFFFTVGNRRRYPAWQFDERVGIVPGVRDVVLAIPDGWRPEQNHAFMTSVALELDLRGERITPHIWLVEGCDPARIVDLIRDREQSQ